MAAKANLRQYIEDGSASRALLTRIIEAACDMGERGLMFDSFPVDNVYISHAETFWFVRSSLHSCAHVQKLPKEQRTEYSKRLHGSLDLLLSESLQKRSEVVTVSFLNPDELTIPNYQASYLKVLQTADTELYSNSLLGAQVTLKVCEKSVAISEFQALCELDHPNIVRSYGLLTWDHEKLALVLEHYQETLESKTVQSLADSACFLLQVLDALDYLHLRGTVHLYLAPSNILLANDGQVKVAGLNFSQYTTQCQVDFLQSLHYLEYVAPEVVTGAEVGPSSDVWSFAMLVHYIFTQTALIPEPKRSSIRSFCEATSNQTFPVLPQLEQTSPELARVIKEATNHVPARRPDLEEFRRVLTALLP